MSFDSDDADAHIYGEEAVRNPGSESRRLRFPHPVTLLLCGILLALVGIGLSVWLPVQQLRQDIANLERRGAVLVKHRGQHALLERWIDLPESDLFPRVIVVDMSRVATTDADLAAISGFAHLRSLAFLGPKVTDTGFEELSHLNALQTLLLVDCPEVSPAAIAKLQAVLPKLQIVRRGPAFLGIASERVEHGCRVLEVVPQTAAHHAGLHPGDIITAFGGEPTPNFEVLIELIGKHQPGEKIKLEVRRGEATLQLEAVLGRWQ